MKNITIFLWLFLINFVVISSGWAQEGVIKVGTITNTPKKEVEKYQPFADYLASHLKDQGIKLGEVVMASSISEMASLLKTGEIDLYVDSPFPVLEIEALSGAKPLLRRWKKGVAEYRSVIFVRKNGGINSLEDLKGKMIAFEDPFSTSGYFLPKATLMQAGIVISP